MTVEELRAWLAVNLMGRVGPQKHDIDHCEDGFFSFCRLCGADNQNWDLENREDCNAHPHYESTWSGMQLVVEAMRAKGYRFTLTMQSPNTRMNDPDRRCEAMFEEHNHDGSRYYGHGVAAPLAVALAARSALESGERGDKG